ncbi:MAG: hypothetical protein Q7T89_02680 [Anaerolineales bacterium]|nr:hypothetical protein [Anaerolineales bacterium]
MSRKALIRLPIILGGIGLILVSIFAFQLGFDNDPGWGASRYGMLALGLGIVLFGTAYWFMPILSRGFENIKNKLSKSAFFQGVNKPFRQVGTQIQKPAQLIRDSSFAVRIRASKLFGWFSRNQSNIWLILLGCCLVWMYVWIVTIGRLDKWPSGKNYYWMLSQAFQQGQTHLLVDPNPELLKLENPYDHHQRKGLEYLWDTTLYNGKYYLYWGPVPAALGVIVSSITSKPVTDTGLVFSFVIGIALFSVLLLRDIYKEYKIPAWVFWGGALASTVNVPLIWMLTRTKFYEVSISGGQFFLMAGFFAMFRAFRFQSPHKGYIAFSAIAFGLAGATRINLLPSVVFLAAVIFWRIYVINRKKIRESIPAFAAAFLPLALIACSLFWYNYDRFGSIFEFGHRYQLTGPSLTTDYKDISSVKYIVPNLYTYVFRLPSLTREFPFLMIPWVQEEMWPPFIHLPEHYYYTEPVAGILIIVPLIGLTALLLMWLFWLFINGDVSLSGNKKSAGGNHSSWFGFAMLGVVAIQLAILLVFINSAMRYLLDVSPALIVLSTMFVGYYLQSVEKKSCLLKLILFAWILAALLTVVSGFFIGFTGDKNIFLNQNPQLYYQLYEWFGG